MVYDRRLETYKRLPPQVVCFENDFYTIFFKDGKQQRTVEKEFTGPVDGIAAGALQKLASQRSLDFEASQGVALFIGLQRTRVPSFRRAVVAAVEAIVEETMLTGFSNAQRASDILADYEKQTGEQVGLTPEASVELVQSGAFIIKANEKEFLWQMLLQSKTITNLVSEYEWLILEASTNSGFITCDDPLVTVPPSEYGGANVGIAIPGAVTYFPLTRRFCLRIERRGHAIRFRRIGAYATRQVNKNIAANSHRFILGPNMSQLKLVVETSASTNAEPDRVRVDVVRGDAGSAKVCAVTCLRRYFYY